MGKHMANLRAKGYLHFSSAYMYCCPNYGTWKILLPKVTMSTVVQLSFSAVVHMLSNPQPFLLTHNLTSTFLLQWKQSACFPPQISPGALPRRPLTLILPSNSSSELTARSKAGSTPFRSLLWACKDRYSIFKSTTILYSVLCSFELWFSVCCCLFE